MANLDVLKLVSNSQMGREPFKVLSKIERVQLSHAIRLFILSMILLFIFFFKFYQVDFINTAVWQPIMLLLVGAFFLNSVAVISSKTVSENHWLNALLFSIDTLVFASLVSGIGIGRSLFIFLFLINIILCGYVYGRSGAYYLALWTTIVFNTVTLFGSDVAGMGLYSSTVLNNISFFAVAALSGMFSREIEYSEYKIEEQSGRIQALTELNELIVENVKSGIISIDSKQNITYVNRAASHILLEENLEGSTLSDVIPATVGLFNKKMLAERSELVYENFKGESLDLEVIVSPLKNSKGTVLGHVLLIQDFTEIKRLQFSLQQKEKLAAVGQLAAGIAHEIRNPLASISGSVQLLEQGTEFKSEDLRLMRIVVREIDRLNTLISEFLVFVRPESIPSELVSISSIIKEVVDVVRVNDQLVVDVEPLLELQENKLILGHKDKLRQALLNMIINAYQAIENISKPKLVVRTYDKENSVILVIQDNGCGISEENQRRIFEPFHTTKAKGTGLGMAITHKILESHGASIFIESEVNKGAIFTIEFPVVENPLPEEKSQKVTA